MVKVLGQLARWDCRLDALVAGVVAGGVVVGVVGAVPAEPLPLEFTPGEDAPPPPPQAATATERAKIDNHLLPSDTPSAGLVAKGLPVGLEVGSKTHVCFMALGAKKETVDRRRCISNEKSVNGFITSRIRHCAALGPASASRPAHPGQTPGSPWRVQCNPRSTPARAGSVANSCGHSSGRAAASGGSAG